MRIRRSVLLIFVGFVLSTIVAQAALAIAPPPPSRHVLPTQPAPVNVTVRTAASLPASTYPWVMPAWIKVGGVTAARPPATGTSGTEMPTPWLTYGNTVAVPEPQTVSSLPAATYPWTQPNWVTRGSLTVATAPAAPSGAATSEVQPNWANLR